MGCTFMCCASIQVGWKVSSLTDGQKILCGMKAQLWQDPWDQEWGKMLKEVGSTYNQQEYLQLHESLQKMFWKE